jgi:hypothetical protein
MSAQCTITLYDVSYVKLVHYIYGQSVVSSFNFSSSQQTSHLNVCVLMKHHVDRLVGIEIFNSFWGGSFEPVISAEIFLLKAYLC